MKQSQAFQKLQRLVEKAKAEDDTALLDAVKIFEELSADVATPGSQGVGDPQIHKISEALKRLEAKIDSLGQALAVALDERIAEMQAEQQERS
ncbi:MAG: hypothetical protein A2428_03715 [Bdellovibrionales bacterium RIFOXYC1_FULL_54_43]|nr:MAG: hypothetical protein A2428_03715 [Bdellovibrionales bacterium RIFOXYC1_FULL_54_43]OFZ83819.1 MAG: hypothetical protein A2603_11140 [Bdellovibrionales bacterium RIFOXYD1_FULL_55_31]